MSIKEDDHHSPGVGPSRPPPYGSAAAVSSLPEARPLPKLLSRQRSHAAPPCPPSQQRIQSPGAALCGCRSRCGPAKTARCGHSPQWPRWQGHCPLCLGMCSCCGFLEDSAGVRGQNIWKREKGVYSSCPKPVIFNLFLFKKDFIFRGRRVKRWRETLMCKRYIDQLPLACPQLGTWPTTQACSLTENWTGDLLVHRPALNPLSHTSQG